jgi:hypothetical protein
VGVCPGLGEVLRIAVVVVLCRTGMALVEGREVTYPAVEMREGIFLAEAEV